MAELIAYAQGFGGPPADYKGAERADAGPDGVGRAERQRPHRDREQPSLASMATAVTIDGAIRVKPCDCFIANAQTTSSSPATTSRIQATPRPPLAR